MSFQSVATSWNDSRSLFDSLKETNGKCEGMHFNSFFFYVYARVRSAFFSMFVSYVQNTAALAFISFQRNPDRRNSECKQTMYSEFLCLHFDSNMLLHSMNYDGIGRIVKTGTIFKDNFQHEDRF